MPTEAERMDVSALRMRERLIDRGADKKCQRCGKTDFSVIPGSHLLKDYGSFSLALPVKGYVCANCGWLALHALTVLFPEDWKDAD